ncbi:unnamed protein product [Prunus armeniaca]|uniref:Uncharacterized protein n=1 Tax=Prunus armeniaca TaxID=36596 RepID=A0A6J5Y7U0_PRUAR|nr:unnamed protein product [Prunus armeniaca]
MMKRMAELEEKVNALSSKPAVMPPEKEDLLNVALNRVNALEQELSATKKALEDTLVRQDELIALLEKKNKKKKKRSKTLSNGKVIAPVIRLDALDEPLNIQCQLLVATFRL